MKFSEVDINTILEHAVGNAGSVVILLIVLAIFTFFIWKIGGPLVTNKLDEFKELKDIVKGFADDVKDVAVKFSEMQNTVDVFTEKFTQLTHDVQEMRTETKEDRKEDQQERKDIQKVLNNHSAQIARLEERIKQK